jgi:hypothetical protein
MPSQGLLGLTVGMVGRFGVSARYICSSCLLRRAVKPAIKRLQQPKGSAQLSTRPAIRRCSSTKASLSYSYVQRLAPVDNVRLHSTTPTPRPIVSINAPSPIPITTRGLHASLLDLERDAINYVPLSRLKLALRSLEKAPEDTVIRVAILGLGQAGGAKRLARCLLADVLGEKQKWESALDDETDKRAILLRYESQQVLMIVMLTLFRYGNGEESSPVNTAFREIYVPSPILQQYKLELIISSLQIDVSLPTQPFQNGDSILDNLLVPNLVATASSAGGYSSVTYPVHKTILLGNGLKDLVSLGRFMASTESSNLPTDLVKLAILNISTTSKTENSEKDDVTIVNVQEAEKAISQFRESVQNAVVYEQAWFGSSVPSIINWLIQGADVSVRLKQPIKSLIDTILADTTIRINLATVALKRNGENGVISENVRNHLNDSITRWAQNAHVELRDSLDNAFRGNWNRLQWWKLFWRVDDVAMIAGDVLERKWLVKSEKELVFISGMMKQAKLLNGNLSRIWMPKLTLGELERAVITDGLQTSDPEGSSQKSQIIGLPTETKQDIYSTPVPTTPPTFIPYPQQIPLNRANILFSDIPTLQRKAQALVFQCLGTTALTSSLGILIYLASPLTTIFESGSIAALGFIIAISRLQSKWEAARAAFEVKLREDGRRALLGTEDDVRAVVREGGQTKPDEVMLDSIEAAQKAVQMVHEALWRMGEK